MNLTEQEKKRIELSDYLQGTCITIAQAVESLELDESIDWEDEMLSAGVEVCLSCGWWHESGELVHDDDEDTGICGDCLGDKNY